MQLFSQYVRVAEERNNKRYISPDIQNELMSKQVLREVNAEVHQAKFYTITVDKTTDRSNREQAVLVLRYVDDNLDVHEELYWPLQYSIN